MNDNSNEALPGNPGNLFNQPSYAEVERLAKELFEEAQRLHPNGGIVITIVAPGAQNIAHLDAQYIYQGNSGDKGESQDTGNIKMSQDLLNVLGTEKEQKIWQKAKAARYVDENLQPLISRTQAALLADEMARRLGIRDKWKTFEALWNRKYMRNDYNLAMTQQQSLDFQDELKRLYSGRDE